MLSYINEVPKSRSYVNEFRGYNHNLIISENEIYDGYNLTSDEYPVLSTRKPRGFIKNLSGNTNVDILGMNGALGLSFVYYTGGNKVVFQYEGVDYYDKLDNDDLLRQIVPFGSKLYIYPDCKVFDTIKYEFSSALGEKKVENYEISYFVDYGTDSNPDIKFIELGEEYKVITMGEGDGGLYRKGHDGKYTKITKSGVRIGVPDKLLALPGAHISNMGNAFDSESVMYALHEYILWHNNDAGKAYQLADGYYIENAYISNHKFNEHGDSAPVNKIYIYDGERLGYQAEEGDAVVVDEDFDDGKPLIISSIKPPLMDFVIECQNRLWGCRKGLNHDGEEVNEIYCTKLGTYNDWYTYDGLADSSYVASVGTPGNFTGAITLSQNPIFFKEDVVHKVYVSASGAHQVYTLDVRGVQEGSHRSLAVVNENVIYKGVRDVLGFDGTNVTVLSDALGDVRYYNAISGADGDKYVMYCLERNTAELKIFTLDTRKGLWHREIADCPIHAMIEYDHRLYIGAQDGMFIHEAMPYEEKEKNVKYMLESGEIGFETPDAKTLCRLDFRVKLALGTSFNVWIQYDSDGTWVEVVRYKGTLATPKSETVYVLPRRCDHFKYKITGSGDMKLYSISKVYERSET